ncbi:MAG: cytochrome b, partial [Methyloglobulus sp.]|nr:cytochrome b [Methyloglobulus sp.]
RNVSMGRTSARSDRSRDSANVVSSSGLDKLSAKHSKATILLHWGTVLAIVVSVGAMFIREYIEEKSYRIGLLEVHRQLGMLVLFGVVMRLAVRYRGGLVKHVAPMSILTRLCAGLCHTTLYLLLIALPLLGWAVTNAHNVDLNLFGIGHLPRLVTDDSDLADELTDYHIWVSWGLLGILVLHIAASLVHHFILKDKVLVAMLPGRWAYTQKPTIKIVEKNK